MNSQGNYEVLYNVKKSNDINLLTFSIFIDAYVSFSRQGTVYILTHFDTLFSALIKFDELALSQQNDAWKVISQLYQN